MNPIESLFIHHRSLVEALPARIWEASWQATLLAAIVLAVQWILKSQLGAGWRHALWLVVFARLLLPALPQARFSAYNWLPWTPPAITAPALPLPANSPGAGFIKSVAHNAQAGTPGHAPAPVSLHDTIKYMHPLTLLALLWGAGAFATAAWGIARHARLRRRVKRTGVEAGPALREQFAAARELLRVKRAELAVSSSVNTPFVTGLWKAKVVLPEGLDAKLSPGDLRMVLLHELAHAKRGDLWMAWLGWLVTALHWFNPAVRLITARVRRDREMACDEWVLRHVNDSEGYGAALIRFLEISLTQAARPGFGAIGIFESKLTLVQRIRRIAAYRRVSFARSAVGFAALALIGIFTLTAATGDAPGTQLVVELTDGSRVIGTPSADALKIATKYAGMQVPLAGISSIEFHGPDHDALVNLRNGDHVSGKLAINEIALKTLFGQTTIPLASIDKLMVRAAAGGGKSLPEGLVLHYTFDASQKEKVTDTSGSGNDGTVRNATYVDDGKVGGSMNFTADQQAVILNNPASLQLQDFTIMAWLKRGDLEKTNANGIGGAFFTAGQGGYGVGMYNGLLFLTKTGYNDIKSTCKVTDKDFHHVVLTKSGTKVVFYLDGVAYPASQDYESSFEFTTGFAVGARPDSMNSGFLGLINELSVFKRALSEDEVKAVYESQK